MGMTLDGLLLGVGLSSTFVAGMTMMRARDECGAVRAPVLTVVCFLTIAAFSFTQLLIAPHLLSLLMREAGQVYAGEPWRLLTSLLVQDGGWIGATFNLIALLALGSIAERILGRPQWALTVALSVITAGLLALLWQPVGAGNSILDCGLAGGICAVALIKPQPHEVRIPVVAASICFVLLLARQDIHGVAAVAGALTAALYAFVKKNNDVDQTVV